MTSNFAVIEAEIIKVIPAQLQTPANLEWVKEELAVSPPSDILATCKEYFAVSDYRIFECESKLSSYGIQIHQITSRLDGQDQKIAALETRVMIAEAVATERHANQNAINANFTAGINSAQQSAVHAASSKSSGGGWFAACDPTAVFILGCFVIAIAALFISSLPTQSSRPQRDVPVVRGY
jgi:hypothetical protein